MLMQNCLESIASMEFLQELEDPELLSRVTEKVEARDAPQGHDGNT